MNSEDPLRQLLNWQRPLNQAMTIEVERGFVNIPGREELFHSFISRSFDSPPGFINNPHTKDTLNYFAKAFKDYPLLSESARKRLVIKSRQFLQGLKQEFPTPESHNPPKLRLKDTCSQNMTNKLSNEGLSLKSPLREVKGVGIKLAEKLSLLGLLSIFDLIKYYPRDYVDYSSLKRIIDLKPGETATIVASIRKCNSFKSPRNPNLAILEIHLGDSSGRIKVTKFFAGKRYSSIAYLKSQAKIFQVGLIVAVSGLVKDGPYGHSFQDPQIEVLENKTSIIQSKTIGRLLAIYSLTEGISADRFRSLVASLIPLSSQLIDPLPKEILLRNSFPSRSEAIYSIHLPRDQDSLKRARRRLVFDEFFLLQLSLLKRRIKIKEYTSPSFDLVQREEGLVCQFFSLLPFSLTRSQQRVFAEIKSDLKKKSPMSRLVQGDVGSGKTVVAIASLLIAIEAGWQGALMAPTEVLAEQHYRTLCKWLPHLHINVELLTGSTTRKNRNQILANLSNGSLNILVGTHALTEDPVGFSRLGLVVVDEQHRFGVRQRNRLLAKGIQPHLLTMTATPIPRTLALSIHGDLDVSQIDELPPGRTPVQTQVISGGSRDIAFDLIRSEVQKGQRAYFVLPLVEDSEKLDLRSAIQVHKELSLNVFPDFQVGLLHGRMSGTDKQQVIADFVNGKCQVLVSTTVVEVGVDVPQASVMVIDNADRFGLAQLHQLRGRVGRASHQSHCILIHESSNSISKTRLKVLESSNDGFEISEIDLRLRGPGQVLGTKQSGLPDFALASLVTDGDLLEQARKEAEALLEKEPELSSFSRLKKVLEQYSERKSDTLHLN